MLSQPLNMPEKTYILCQLTRIGNVSVYYRSKSTIFLAEIENVNIHGSSHPHVNNIMLLLSAVYVHELQAIWVRAALERGWLGWWMQSWSA